MRSEKGCIRLIRNIIIFVIFAIALYACLDFFEIIEVDDEYSIPAWIKENVDINIDGDNANIKVDENAVDELNEKINDKMDSQSMTYNPFKKKYSYYNQLDDYGKIIYSKIFENIDNFKSVSFNEIDFKDTFNDLLNEEGGKDKLDDSFQTAINSLKLDNPDLFYIDISSFRLEISETSWAIIKKSTYNVKIRADNDINFANSTFKSDTSIKYAINNVQDIKKRIVNIANSYEKTEEKIKYVHNYLVDHVTYDESLSLDNAYNEYGALINGYSVCEGYAVAFKSIMDDLEIDCITVFGDATNSKSENEAHAWNYVNVDGTWYAIDVTWDDPIIIGDGIVNPSVKYKYYLKGANSFNSNHYASKNLIDGISKECNYPELSYSDY